MFLAILNDAYGHVKQESARLNASLMKEKFLNMFRQKKKTIKDLKDEIEKDLQDDEVLDQREIQVPRTKSAASLE